MAGIENNLYPPIVDTYMPAFVRTSPCRVYFSLSNYNNERDIQGVQVTVVDQDTNLSALDRNKYPEGIKFFSLVKDYRRSSDDKYYISIFPGNLKKGFELNKYYKVQLRFTGVGAVKNQTKNSKWLIDNQKYFSEWSTVCLIKGIEKPSIYLKGFEDIGEKNEIIFNSEFVDLVGRMYYEKNAGIEKESLKSYRIIIFKKPDYTLIYDSEDIYTNIYNPNEINHTLKTTLEDGTSYSLSLYYTTTNNYTSGVLYNFLIMQRTIDPLNAKIVAIPDEELGRMKIDIIPTVAEDFFGNLTIRRSSSENNFTIWEDVHQTTITGELLEYTWYDYTVESGIWYKYCVQERNSKGNRGTSVVTENPVMIILDDIFLTTKDMQIKLKYNPQISSFKKTVLQSKTDTLGSKYPIIRRNGNVEYRQFPISGLITTFCNYNEKDFTDNEGFIKKESNDEDINVNKDKEDEKNLKNREDIFGDNTILYDRYNEANNINKYQDFIYERKFREKIMDFLYANTVKLFRSATEGNILIKLMDISFTPNQTLGRMLYTFSATAYEIDECSLSNFEKYNIQSIGTYSTYLKDDFIRLGQLHETYKEYQNIFDILKDKYKEKATYKYINKVKSIKWLRLEFNMLPYLISKDANNNIAPLSETQNPTENTMLGYIVYIDNVPIIVSSRGLYELTDEDTKITSIYFPKETSATIDYIVEGEKTENPKLLFNKMYFYTKVGQIGDTFDINENVFLRIYNKYLLKYSEYEQELYSLDRITIEAVPGTIVYIQDSSDGDLFKHEIGSTGVLEFYDPNTIITGIKFGGIRLYEANENRNEVEENEFKETNKSVNSFEEITNPIKNGVYTVDNKRYIYYREKWFEFPNDENDEKNINVVQCPTDALIDYICEVMKGEY